MDALASQNEQDAAAIADLFTRYVNDDAEFAPYMQGCDPALYATWSVLGLEFEDDGVFIAGQEGYAYVNVTARDGFELVDLWSNLLDQAAADPGLATQRTRNSPRSSQTPIYRPLPPATKCMKPPSCSTSNKMATAHGPLWKRAGMRR